MQWNKIQWVKGYYRDVVLPAVDGEHPVDPRQNCIKSRRCGIMQSCTTEEFKARTAAEGFNHFSV